ncbi:MAG: flagellar export chaperone FliS [Alphaproteobacteria bacterium]|nr:flagellar export chaperone FliS [Alphaproteobacteria bacterium]MDD9919329.1 flagellar export chaperone FliS [Alphaproteobacteria bacterium]
MDKQKLQARQYLEKQIQNSSPAQQIVMLYDGVIKFTSQAQKAIDDGNIEARCNANRRAMEIVSYLLEILDVEKGEELGQRLNKIYAYVLQKMLQVDLNNSREATEEILLHMRTLRQAWLELAQQGAQPAPQQESSSAPKASRPVVSKDEAGTERPVTKRSAIA